MISLSTLVAQALADSSNVSLGDVDSWVTIDDGIVVAFETRG